MFVMFLVMIFMVILVVASFFGLWSGFRLFLRTGLVNGLPWEMVL